jgi:hypothetical protein
MSMQILNPTSTLTESLVTSLDPGGDDEVDAYSTTTNTYDYDEYDYGDNNYDAKGNDFISINRV